MKKGIYLLSIIIGIALLIFFYLIYFDKMSETMLLNSVLFWYVPLIFGMYGLTAMRISKTIGDPDESVIRHLFSGRDPLVLVFAIIIMILGGIIGIVMFFLPITIFKVKSSNYDVFVALTGLVSWLLLLEIFFQVIWPSL